MNGRESKAFNVRVGVHQGSVLSPLLFIILLEALSREFREGLPMELLYADDLVLIAEIKERFLCQYFLHPSIKQNRNMSNKNDLNLSIFEFATV